MKTKKLSWNPDRVAASVCNRRPAKRNRVNNFDLRSNLFVMDEEPRNDDAETRPVAVEYVSAILRNGMNNDERRDDW